MDRSRHEPVVAGLLAVALLAGACGARPAARRPPSLSALKLDVLAGVGGRLDYCDPDLYPVAHGTPLSNARRRLPIIRADRAAYQAILAHLHIVPGARLSDQELIAIDEDYKQIQAIKLVASPGGYRFTVYVPAIASPTRNESISGFIATTGKIRLRPPGAGQLERCPI